jgi:hypothetical protein
MNAMQHQTDFPEVQEAIYRVALSLDAFLLNGIPYGVIQRDVFNGFLQTTAGNLLTELARLEEEAPHAAVASQSKVGELVASLRTRCQQLIDLMTGLSSFRTQSLEQLRSTVSQIPLLREQCVQLIQELEGWLRTPQPFYQSRPAHSAATVNDFLSNLECAFAEEWRASGTEKELSGTDITTP